MKKMLVLATALCALATTGCVALSVTDLLALVSAFGFDLATLIPAG